MIYTQIIDNKSYVLIYGFNALNNAFWASTKAFILCACTGSCVRVCLCLTWRWLSLHRRRQERHRRAATGSCASPVLLLQHHQPTTAGGETGQTDTVHGWFQWKYRGSELLLSHFCKQHRKKKQALNTWKSWASTPMASPVADIGQSHHQHQHPVTESAADSAFQEAQKWIEVSDWKLNTVKGNSLVTMLPFRAGVLCCNCVALVTGLLATCICSALSMAVFFYCFVTCWNVTQTATILIRWVQKSHLYSH